MLREKEEKLNAVKLSKSLEKEVVVDDNEAFREQINDLLDDVNE